MKEPTDRLKIREIVEESFFDKETGKVKEYHQNLVTDGWLGKNTSIHTDNNVSSFEFTSNESLSTRFIRDTHISFARFYLHYSNQEPPLSDEQIYAMWQEKSREK